MVLLDVPLYPQETPDTCADASARMCIGYYFGRGLCAGGNHTIPSEKALIFAYGKGSVNPIVNGLKDYNGIVFSCDEKHSPAYFKDVVEKSLRNGHPVILDIVLESASLFGYTTAGHYVVVTGLDDATDSLGLIVNDPYHRDGYGIGQIIRLGMHHAYRIVKYMIRENSCSEPHVPD